MLKHIRDLAIREIGCICCRKYGYGYTPCDKHHLLDSGKHGNGRRRGEDETIGLCQYHHQGKKQVGSNVAKWWRSLVGPSYADEAAAFREEFGNDDDLLAYQNDLIKAWSATLVGRIA